MVKIAGRELDAVDASAARARATTPPSRTRRTPASTISRMNACTSGASGVVRVASNVAVADAIGHGAHQPALDAGGFEDRAARGSWSSSCRWCPVMPTTRIWRLGCPKNSAASCASASRASATTIHGHAGVCSGARSATMAAAPAAIACGANAAPSTFRPAQRNKHRAGLDLARVIASRPCTARRALQRRRHSRRVLAGHTTSTARAATRGPSWRLAALAHRSADRASERQHDGAAARSARLAGGQLLRRRGRRRAVARSCRARQHAQRVARAQAASDRERDADRRRPVHDRARSAAVGGSGRGCSRVIASVARRARGAGALIDGGTP